MADEEKNETHEFDVEVFSVGKWKGDDYNDEDLDDMVKNFDALKDSIKPPVKLGHNQEQMKEVLADGHPALGWVKTLRKVGSKLVATLTQVPDIVFKAIKSGRYKRVSSEIYWNYKQAGKIHRRVFAGIALLGADVPAITNLKDLEAYLSQSMQDTASFEKLVTCAFDQDDTGSIQNEESDEKGGSEMAEETKAYIDKIAALESENATLKASDEKAKEYKAELDAIKKDQAEGRKSSQENTLKEFCEKMVEEGKMPPAMRDKLVGFDKMNYSEDAGYSVPVESLIDALKCFDKIILKTDEKAESKSDEKETFENVYVEVDTRAKKHATDNKVTYSQAVQAILSADKELADRYAVGGAE